MAEVEALLESTVLFTLLLALALLVERFTEIIKVIFDYLDYRLDGHVYWTRAAEKLHAKLVRKLAMLEYAEPGDDDKLLKSYQERSLNAAGGYKGKSFVISGDLMRVMAVRSAAKIIGIILGVLLAYLFQIDLFYIWKEIGKEENQKLITSVADRQWSTSIILSGVALGLGSGPVHKLITTIERVNKKRQEKKAAGGN